MALPSSSFSPPPVVRGWLAACLARPHQPVRIGVHASPQANPPTRQPALVFNDSSDAPVRRGANDSSRPTTRAGSRWRRRCAQTSPTLTSSRRSSGRACSMPGTISPAGPERVRDGGWGAAMGPGPAVPPTSRLVYVLRQGEGGRGGWGDSPGYIYSHRSLLWLGNGLRVQAELYSIYCKATVCSG